MNHEEELSEYLDGRLDAAGRRRVEALLAADPALERRLRLLKAMRGALRAEAEPAPAGLKARLRAVAIERRERPSWLGRLRETFTPKPWAFAGASAFAAALVVLALRHDRPALPVPAPIAAEQQAWTQGAEYRDLTADLWSDDEGGDDEAL